MNELTAVRVGRCNSNELTTVRVGRGNRNELTAARSDLSDIDLRGNALFSFLPPWVDQYMNDDRDVLNACRCGVGI